MRALALDFDGVLVDSAREVLAVAAAAYAELVPDSRLSARFVAGDDGLLAVPAELAAAFERLVPLGNRAEDFGAALAALDRGLALADQADYDRFFAGLERAWCDAFHRAFYRHRVALRSRDLAAWLGLHRAYQPFVAVLDRHRAEARIAIATSKDRSSVRLLADHLGFGHLVADELVEDKDAGPDKARHVAAIAARLGLATHAITFVDDKVRHLEAVAAGGARVVLAGWGHTTAAELARAAAAGFRVATLATVEDLLFTSSEGSPS